MAVPRRFADFNPVSVSYSPLVPIISEASATPIPVTKKAAKEIQGSVFPPLGKIISYIGNFAKKASSNSDFNALMGVLAQYLLNYVNDSGSSTANVPMMGYIQPPPPPPPPPQPQSKSWFRRLHEYWNLSPAEKREQEYHEQLQQQYNQYYNQHYNQQPLQQQQNTAAVQRSQFLSSAAPFVGRIANAYVPGSGDLVTSGLLALGKKLGFGRKRCRRRGGAAAAEGTPKAAKVKKKKNTFI